MAFIIDSIYVAREITLLILVVMTSPMAIIGSLLLIGSYISG